MQARNLVAFVALVWSGCLLSPDGPCKGGGVRVPPDNLCECPDGSVLVGRHCVEGADSLALDASMPEADALPRSDADPSLEDGGIDTVDGLDTGAESSGPTGDGGDAEVDLAAPCDGGQLVSGQCIGPGECPPGACSNGSFAAGSCTPGDDHYTCTCRAGYAGTGTQRCYVVVDVEAGDRHTCAVRSDRSVACWGGNVFGQLGDGSTRDALTPVDVSIAGAVEVALGPYHSCARKADGSVFCWGANEVGQLGAGHNMHSPVPVAVAGLSGVASLAAGGAHTCARKTDGSVACWGLNDYGQLGNGTLVDSNTPVVVSGIGSVTHLAAGTQHTCARKTDGTVACWGINDFTLLADSALGDYSMTPVPIKGLEDVVDITSANVRVCALKRDGGVTCWGSAWDDDIDSTAPTVVAGLTDIIDIVAGSGHACALGSGVVYCWGLNRYGQLGNGTTMTSNVPVMVPGVSGVTGITAGGGHTCARKTDASVLCWGLNDSGELGNGMSSNSTMPVAVVGL